MRPVVRLALIAALLAPLLAAAAPTPPHPAAAHALPPIDPGAPPAVHPPHEVDTTDAPATPIEGAYRVHVILDRASAAVHPDPSAWVTARFAEVNRWFGADHGIRFVVCRVAVADLGREFHDVRNAAHAADSSYARGLPAHTGIGPVDAAGGECAGPATLLGEPSAPDLMVTLVAPGATCNGAPVGGCADLLGSFSMTVDYSMWSGGEGWGAHAVEHVLMHEISHNFGALDNECAYGLMNYGHTYWNHDWCTRDEARMTAGKHLPRTSAVGLLGLAG